MRRTPRSHKQRNRSAARTKSAEPTRDRPQARRISVITTDRGMSLKHLFGGRRLLAPSVLKPLSSMARDCTMLARHLTRMHRHSRNASQLCSVSGAVSVWASPTGCTRLIPRRLRTVFFTGLVESFGVAAASFASRENGCSGILEFRRYRQPPGSQPNDHRRGLGAQPPFRPASRHLGADQTPIKLSNKAPAPGQTTSVAQQVN